MTRRASYTIVEGTKEDPKKLIVKVGCHNGKYGRASLPVSLVGRMIEVVVLPKVAESVVKAVPSTAEAVGKLAESVSGESMVPMVPRLTKIEEVK